MGSGQLSGVLRHIRKLAGTRAAGTLTDGQLLERFIVGQDEAAFEAILQRHGAMVLGVCRRILSNPHDAEDAFQATFLVLVCKAGAIAKRDSAGSWLYGVAQRIALRARARAERQRAHAKPLYDAADIRQASVPTEAGRRELCAALDEELNRLPEKHRAPLVLCYLEGKSRNEAAQELCWPLGTLQRRLTRGQQLLHSRLVRRGVTLSAALAAVELSRSTSPAAVPSLLSASTLKAAVLVAAGKGAAVGAVSAQTAALTKAALNALFLAKIKTVLVVVLTVGVIGLGAGTATQRLLAQWRSGVSKPTGLSKRGGLQEPPENKTVSTVQPSGAEEKNEMMVTGRVLDPDGKPVANAQVAVFCNRKGERPGLTLTDQEGRFQLRTRRTSSRTDYRVSVIAVAAGYGLGWQSLHPDTEKPEAELRVRPEQVLRGRLIDLQGQGAAGVKVHLAYIALKNPKEFTDSVGFQDSDENGVPWPAPVTTDGQGRFTFHGIGRDLLVGLDIMDDRFARQTLQRIDTGDPDHAKEITLPLEPPQIVEGRVICEDTAKPLPHAGLQVSGANMEPNRPTIGNGAVTSSTDAEGRFQVSSYPGNTVTVYVYPPEGTGYLGVWKMLPWPKGTTKQKVDLAVPRGVLVRGKVTESASGHAVAEAQVDFVPRRDKNPYYRDDIVTRHPQGNKTGPDGTFQIAVLPGPGHLVVQGSTPDFIQREVYYDHFTGNLLDAPPEKEPGIIRAPPSHWFLSNFATLDLKPEAEPPPVSITLRRGVTVKGRLVGPDGKPVTHAKMLCQLAMGSTLNYDRRYPVDLRDARFELTGCDPDIVYPVYFLDAQNQWGAVAEISGKQSGESVEVRLVPCGSVVMRLLNREGRPLANYRPNSYGSVVVMLLKPRFPASPRQQNQTAADPDTVWLSEMDRLHYLDGPVTDGQGRITLPALIPGVTYRFNDNGSEREITVEAGKHIELPDMVIAYPGR